MSRNPAGVGIAGLVRARGRSERERALRRVLPAGARAGVCGAQGCRRGRWRERAGQGCGAGVGGSVRGRVAGAGGGVGVAGAGPATADVRNAPPTSGCTKPAAHPGANATNAPRERRICAGRNRGEIAMGRPDQPAAIRLAVRRRRAAPSLPISDGGLRRNRCPSCQSGGRRGFWVALWGDVG